MLDCMSSTLVNKTVRLASTAVNADSPVIGQDVVILGRSVVIVEHSARVMRQYQAMAYKVTAKGTSPETFHRDMRVSTPGRNRTSQIELD